MEKKLHTEFIKEFSENDEHRLYIVKLIKDSYDIILNRANSGVYKEIDDFYNLWYINKHYYEKFISYMIGKLLGLYSFDDEYSRLINTKLNNIDTSSIDKFLKDNGYFVLDKKLDKEICIKISNSAKDKIFQPYKTNLKVLGGNIFGKILKIGGSSTFWIINQDDILGIQEVKDIVTDPFILKIVQNYLGCNPILCQTNMWYSCSNNNAERTQQFHQDYDDINFLKVFIYLTDVDKNCGPHSYISKSLNNMRVPPGYKPSTRLTDTFARNTYKDDIKIFTGEIGTIIIENTKGFHRGMPVIKGHRLVLQLQYSATLLPFQRGCTFSKLKKNEFMRKYPLCYLKLNN